MPLQAPWVSLLSWWGSEPWDAAQAAQDLEPQRHAHPARTARLWPGRFYIRRVGSARSSDLPAHQRGAGRTGGGAWPTEGAEDTSEKFRPHGGVLSPLHPASSLPTRKGLAAKVQDQALSLQTSRHHYCECPTSVPSLRLLSQGASRPVQYACALCAQDMKPRTS